MDNQTYINVTLLNQKYRWSAKEMDVWLYLLTLVKPAGKLNCHPKAAKFNWSTVLFAGKKDTVRFDVAVNDVIVMAIFQGLKIMSIIFDF